MNEIPTRLFVIGWAVTTLFLTVLAMPLFYFVALWCDREKVYHLYQLYKLFIILIAGTIFLWISLT